MPTESEGRDGDRQRPGSGRVSVHEPVLLAEVLDLLALAPGMTVVDGTVGAGGHSLALARAIGSGGTLVGLDRDLAILAHAGRRLGVEGSESRAGVSGEDAGSARVHLVHRCFTEIRSVLEDLALSAPIDRVLLDVGVSSLQLDDPDRGFSFRHDGPLDMRMDRATAPDAAAWLARVSERELVRVLRDYGEERFSKRIARAIVEHRGRRGGLRTTGQLADLVARTVPRGGGRIHPATRTFQAIRIAVNDELGRLERGLEAAHDALAEGGRLAVISFHSLEDGIVKRFVRERMHPVVRKPVRPSEAECRRNPRARSARLRCGERRTEARPTEGAA